VNSGKREEKVPLLAILFSYNSQLVGVVDPEGFISEPELLYRNGAAQQDLSFYKLFYKTVM
jgi:hypothetical protein